MKRATGFTGAALLVVFLAAGPAWSITAGPDDFGYTAADDASGVTYGWIDMSGGTDVVWSPGACTDDCQSTAIPLGFTFNFYGTDYTDVYVLANGVIVFTSLLAAEYAPFFGAQCPLPKADEVDNMVAFYQRDFNSEDATCGAGCWERHMTGGTEPNRWWGLTFNAVPIFRDAGSTEDPDPVEVQVILYEGSNEVRIQVADSGLKNGEDTMLGVEGQNGVAGLSFPGCLTAGYTRDNQAIVFTPPSGGTPVIPPSRVGWDQPDNTVTHDFVVYNLDDTDVTFAITVTGNAWATTPSLTTLPVTAHTNNTFSVDVDIPTTAVGGDSDEATITLTPTAGTTMTATTITLVQDAPDNWQIFAYMPRQVDNAAVASEGNVLYIIGGTEYDSLASTRTYTDYFQALDTTTMAWNDSVGGTLPALPGPRYMGVRACGMNGHVYVTGGQTDSTDPLEAQADDLFIYDISANTWSSGALMPAARGEHMMVCDAANDTLYVIGGWGPFDATGSASGTDTVWAYDADADTWDTTLTPFPGERVRASAQMISATEILVAAGALDGFFVKRTDIYDITADSWEQTGDLVWERFYNASGILPTDRMCVYGGTGFGALPALVDDSYECYSGGFWIPQLATMTQAKTFLAGTSVGDQLYAVGGVTDTDSLATPSTYVQTNRIERYPTTDIPDVTIDVPEDTAADTAEDTESDVPTDVVVDTATDTPADTSTDVPTDTATDTGDGGGDDGCGCSIVH